MTRVPRLLAALAAAVMVVAACGGDEAPESREFNAKKDSQDAANLKFAEGKTQPAVKGADEFVAPTAQTAKTVPFLTSDKAIAKFTNGLPDGSPQVSALPGPSSGSSKSSDRAYGSLPYEYVNQLTTLDDWHRDRACGQAAVATALTAMGVKGYPNPFTQPDPYPYARGKLDALLRAYKPDVLGGWFGTSWQRMQEMVSKEGGSQIRYGWNSGMDNLVRHLWNNGKNDRIAIIPVDVGGWGPFGAIGLHWVVVYGFDGTYYWGNPNSSGSVFMSNTSGYKMSFRDLQTRWANNGVMRAAGLQGYFLWLDKP